MNPLMSWPALRGVNLFCVIVLLLSVLSPLCWADLEPEIQDKSRLIMGFYAQSIAETASRSDIEVSLNFWAKELLAAEAKKQYQLDITQTQAVIFDDMTAMQQALRRGELDMVVAPPLTISKYFTRDELTTGFIGMLGENQPDSILLIARVDRGINSVADLKGKSIELLEGDELTETFVDYVFLKEFHKSYKTVLGSINQQTKASRIVLDIYFKKADAGVVFKGPFDVMAELNPDIANSIRILDSYPSLSRNVSFFRKNYAYAYQIKEIAQSSFKDNVRVKQILEIFKTPVLIEFDVNQLDQFDAYNDEYQKLKQKYAP